MSAFPTTDAGADLQNYRSNYWNPAHADTLKKILDMGWGRVLVNKAKTPVATTRFFQYTSADPTAAYFFGPGSPFVQNAPVPAPVPPPAPPSGGGTTVTSLETEPRISLGIELTPIGV